MDASLKYENDQLKRRDTEHTELRCKLYAELVEMGRKIDHCLDQIQKAMGGID